MIGSLVHHGPAELLQSSARPAPWVGNHTTRRTLLVLQFAYPVILLFFFLLAFTIRSIRSASNATLNCEPVVSGPGGKPLPNTDPTRNAPKGKVKDDVTRSQKLLFEWVSIGVALTFIGNFINVIVHAIYSREEEWWCGQSVVIYVVGAFFVYMLLVISLVDSKPAPNSVHLATWSCALVLEIILLAASFSLYTHAHREKRAGKPRHGHLRFRMTEWEITEVVVDLLRIILLIALIGFYVLFVTLRNRKKHAEAQNAAETQGLLAESRTENGENGHANGGYGSTQPVGGPHAHPEGAGPGWSRPVNVPARNWWDYIKGYHVFFPYLWPSKDRKLQIIVVICFILVTLQRVVNLAVPIAVGWIINELSGESGRGDGGKIVTPWGAICLYVLLRFIQGNNGVLGAIRSSLWIPIGQYSYRELSVAAFEHVHGLSLDFHLGKKTGEVLSALGKGASINTFLEQVTFSVLPMLVDLCVAIGYFLIAFDAYYALVVSIVTFWYIYLTIRMAQWRAEMRRDMVNADREEDAVKNDSMVSYETVKYFNAEQYEFKRYRSAVEKFQAHEYGVLFSLNLMNVTQNMVFMLGLMVTCFICAYQVTTGQSDVGRFVSLLTYMAQLQQPLNFFGTFYRMIQSAMINSERMLELFKEKPTVVDKDGAGTLPTCEGDIRFNEVQFSYDNRKPALQGLDFHCAPGTTTAFVGESGGGKSTVFRLLFRFYNILGGNIQVDGHDVVDLTIDSLRRHIGVVPQDTVLFNETLMYNLKYADPDATDEQVYEACRAASIHDKIMAFPDRYETRVGERGLRLSGGEKQRVAIARTILKNPRIIMLDEATAALDTTTEQHIQEALTTLGKGRTMLVIAHRLSTITRADQILVLHKGKVHERGTHAELLALKGKYANMWEKQIQAQRAAEEAKVLKDKADRLRRESIHDDDESSTSPVDSEDERTKASGSGTVTPKVSSGGGHHHGHHGH
ncbi:hypothetical protein BU16DRAFT_528418 [Lophium mytilinum]|uniref:Heavy metal tolerance protein n=1 Tax=Lophium mytilinum TaxID=390894 RepID=A0A6A6QP56_9PEZI|nr:hypothetical protein BU16DRAFT_528418 [Lophium mytilinum]